MEEIKILKLKVGEDVPENYTGCVEFVDGTKKWFKEDYLHRIDGPAVEYVDGTKFWFKEGKRHRLDGPAFEIVDGDKYWYVEDKLIRREYGVYLIPGKFYKLTGERYYQFFKYSKSNKAQFCLVLGNREEQEGKEGKITYFLSKVLLNNSIVELAFNNETFEELE